MGRRNYYETKATASPIPECSYTEPDLDHIRQAPKSKSYGSYKATYTCGHTFNRNMRVKPNKRSMSMRERYLRYGKPTRPCKTCESLAFTDELLEKSPNTVKRVLGQGLFGDDSHTGSIFSNIVKVQANFAKNKYSISPLDFLTEGVLDVLRSPLIDQGLLAPDPSLKWMVGLTQARRDTIESFSTDTAEFVNEVDEEKLYRIPPETFEHHPSPHMWYSRRVKLFSREWLITNSMFYTRYLESCPLDELVERLDTSPASPLINARLNGTWDDIKKELENSV